MNTKLKFVVTSDLKTVDKFISAGMSVVSNIGGVYTFLNKSTENFNFSGLDQSKFYFTNMLSL